MGWASWMMLLFFRPAPESAREMAQKARLAMAAGQMREAEATLRKAVAENGTRQDMVFLLGFCLYLENNFEEAARWLDKVAPADSQALLYRGLAREGMGQTDRAATLYREAIRLDARNTEARLVLARVLRREGDTAAAEEQADAALLVKPDARDALYEKGQCLFERGAFAQAAEMAEKTLAAPGPAPSEREVQFLAARAYLKAGNVPLAEKHRAAFEALPMPLVR